MVRSSRTTRPSGRRFRVPNPIFEAASVFSHWLPYGGLSRSEYRPSGRHTGIDIRSRYSKLPESKSRTARTAVASPQRARESNPQSYFSSALTESNLQQVAFLQSVNVEHPDGSLCPQLALIDRRLPQLIERWNSLPAFAQQAILAIASSSDTAEIRP